ncbi:hypothetical protein [Coleofasciculus sp. FACHB-T130]|uniref:hypothetical protein n=1 Tax=Cyanophyceae TaxID=3028117 RepID=UPI0016822278|nr:hypothetical protein [Coleofasciculus sp. FACHB-T130]MBD1880946.1 hypothetical protein [Coleofasciculus sp. FACHB-T130]
MSSQSQRSLNWLLQQFQLKPGKPDIAASLQTLVLVLVHNWGWSADGSSGC